VKVGSLFSGIGGLDHGLARAGHQHVFFCESDAYRRDVLAARWPGVPVYDDVRTLGVDAGRGHGRSDADLRPGGDCAQAEVPEHVDLVCGGFPCQDLSVAGQRRGLAGARSGLFHEFARIIDALQPRWVLVENVPGLLSSNGGRDFGVVLGTLADLGYGVAWRILDSRFFGVPQRRRRVFIVGAKSVGDPRAAAERAGEVLAVGSRCPGHPPTGTETRQEPAVASLSGLGSGGPDDNDGQANRVIVAKTMMSSKTSGWRGNDTDETFVVAAPLTKGSATGEGVNPPGRRKEDDVNIVVSPPLVSRSSRGNAQGNSPGHNADAVVAWSVTLASDPISARELAQPSTKRNGDPGVVAYPLARRGRDGGSELEVGEPGVYNALRAGDGGSSRLNQVMVDMAVRRLTPIECERLQGLPDGWTQLDEKTPDSRRYSALGDAVTANVAEWIGGRL
jgi:DNA (cytosine-5)-methyltransferase 1